MVCIQRRVIGLLALVVGVTGGTVVHAGSLPTCTAAPPSGLGAFQAAAVHASGKGVVQYSSYALPSLPSPLNGHQYLVGVHLTYNMLPVLGGGTTIAQTPGGSAQFIGGQNGLIEDFVGQVTYYLDSYSCQSANTGAEETYEFFDFTVASSADGLVPSVSDNAVALSVTVTPDDSPAP
ncbi:MAG: hypothetical protein ACYDAY_04260 [Candidatus Dormibacteria bacterium]